MPPDGGEVIAEGSRETGGLLRRHGWKLLLLFAGVLLPMWAFMELADEVLDFMFAHLARDFPSLLAGLARLDRASMEKQRRVTLPLAREVFAS